MMEEWRELRLSFGQELTPKILLLCFPHLLWKETNYPCVPWVTQFPQQWAQIIKSKDNLFFLHLNTKDWIFYLFPLLLLIPPFLVLWAIWGNERKMPATMSPFLHPFPEFTVVTLRDCSPGTHLWNHSGNCMFTFSDKKHIPLKLYLLSHLRAAAGSVLEVLV